MGWMAVRTPPSVMAGGGTPDRVSSVWVGRPRWKPTA